MILGILGAPLDAVAYTVAPQSVLAPVGMVGMLFSLLAAQRLHGDDLTLKDLASAVAVLFGAACCLHSGSSETATPSWDARKSRLGEKRKSVLRKGLEGLEP